MKFGGGELSTNFKKINREKVQIFLPIGKCLRAFLVLFQAGKVCATNPTSEFSP